MSNFHPLEVIGRGSETQLQLGDVFNYMTQGFKGVLLYHILIFVK